jgi:hypothetical protein
MTLKIYYLLGAIATILACMLECLINAPTLNNPITYLYIGFLICLQVVYYVLRRKGRAEKKQWQ